MSDVFSALDTSPEGISLHDLATQVDAISREAQDFVVPSTGLEFRHSGDRGYTIGVRGIGEFEPRKIFHRQLATRIGVPANFYDKARNYPEEFVPLVQKLIDEDWAGEAMVRTVGSQARAMLSPSYRRIDNFQVLPTVISAVQELGDFQVKSASLSESKMYMKFVFPQVRREVVVGDEVESGVIISNSEVGQGSFSVMPFIHRLICSNGMVINDLKSSRRHVGRNLFDGGDSAFVLRDDTLAAEDQAILLKMRDLIHACVDEVIFEKYVEKLAEARGEKIVIGVDKAVDRLASTYKLRQGERDGVLAALIEGADISRYGLVNAVTHTAKSAESYDRAVELETLGGQIIDLAPSQWRELAAA